MKTTDSKGAGAGEEWEDENQNTGASSPLGDDADAVARVEWQTASGAAREVIAGKLGEKLARDVSKDFAVVQRANRARERRESPVEAWLCDLGGRIASKLLVQSDQGRMGKRSPYSIQKTGEDVAAYLARARRNAGKPGQRPSWSTLEDAASEATATAAGAVYRGGVCAPVCLLTLGRLACRASHRFLWRSSYRSAMAVFQGNRDGGRTGEKSKGGRGIGVSIAEVTANLGDKWHPRLMPGEDVTWCDASRREAVRWLANAALLVRPSGGRGAVNARRGWLRCWRFLVWIASGHDAAKAAVASGWDSIAKAGNCVRQSRLLAVLADVSRVHPERLALLKAKRLAGLRVGQLCKAWRHGGDASALTRRGDAVALAKVCRDRLAGWDAWSAEQWKRAAHGLRSV